MIKQFHKGETVICSRNVKDPDTKQYYDPATSMKITITDQYNGLEVANQDMVKDATGKYHYDYHTASDNKAGKYKVIYVATDGSRVTMEVDYFELD